MLEMWSHVCFPCTHYIIVSDMCIAQNAENLSSDEGLNQVVLLIKLFSE